MKVSSHRLFDMAKVSRIQGVHLYSVSVYVDSSDTYKNIREEKGFTKLWRGGDDGNIKLYV